MNEKQKQDEYLQLSQNQTDLGGIAQNHQQSYNSQSSATRDYGKPHINKSLLVLFVISFWLGLSMIGLIIGDIRAGVLRGEPETGWGILFAIFLVGPLFLIFSLITFLRARKARKDGYALARTIKYAGIITLILVLLSGLYSYGMSKYENYASKGRREQGQRQAELNKNKNITVEYATELLNSCKLKDYFYGEYIKSDKIKSQLIKQSDLIVLVQLNGNPRNIHVGDKVNIQLLPIAENAKKNCPQFAINGV